MTDFEIKPLRSYQGGGQNRNERRPDYVVPLPSLVSLPRREPQPEKRKGMPARFC